MHHISQERHAVILKKKMEATENITVGELAAKDYRKVEVFKKYGIDFCCGGKKTLDKVCREKGLDSAQLKKDLQALEEGTQLPSQDFYSWEPSFLADYIVNTHHRYVTQSIPLLFDIVQKVARVHGQEHPETVQVSKLFLQVMDEINRHMMKEENILFPYIKMLADAKRSGGKIKPSQFGTVQNPINMMEHEHDVVGELMHEIRRVTANYELPAGACNSYRYSYAKLNEFEEDLHQHIHLENNILFPKAIQLEQELTSS